MLSRKKEKTIDIYFLQETEIPNGYDISLLNIPGFNWECENKTQGKKVRLFCYIRETLIYKRKFEEEN